MPDQEPPPHLADDAVDAAAEGEGAVEAAVAGGVGAAPAEVVELAAALRDYVRRAVGLAVDGAPETLPLVDHYVDLVRAERAQRPEVVMVVAPALGAYFGELLRQRIGGFWRLPSQDVHRWRVCSRQVRVAVNPVGIAYEALFRGEPHDGPAAEVELDADDRDLVTARLSALPSVREEEYYLLSTRLEVLEIVVEALVARRPPGARDVELDWEDYEDLVPER